MCARERDDAGRRGDRPRDRDDRVSELADLVAGWKRIGADDRRTATLSEGGDAALAESFRILSGVAAFGAPEGGGDDEDGPPPDLGPFEPLERIGTGGMGEVWLARQVEPLDRVVAVKLLKTGMDSRRVLQRFDGERQALARMEHPNVATVLDAGLSADGRPWFSMAYVRGAPITDWCDERRLGIRERLELFLPVCEAVQHAHHRGIIHRDLKPSNVLVEEIEGRPVPKVIDFGIAKSTSSDLEEHGPAVTEIGQLVGTPEYMSPEQADLTGRNVDTRADIWALGVLLYELLSGSLPFAPETLRGGGVTEIRRVLATVDPPRPSARAAADTETATRRRTTPAALARALRDDLDWICLRAMEKDRERRYSAAADLADDVRRHLRHEAVAAGPPSAAYRLRKLVRRRRGLVTGASVAAALLIAGGAATAWQAVRATRAETEARRQADVAQAVNEFLGEMLSNANPEVNPAARDLTVAAALDRAAARVDDAFPGQPEVEAAVRSVIAEAYSALSRYEEAERHFGRALELAAGQRRAGILSDAALNDIRRDRLDVAEARATEAVAIAAATDGDPAFLADRLHMLAMVRYRQSRLAEADSLYARVFALLDEVPEAERGARTIPRHTYGLLLDEMGRFDEAESLFVASIRELRAERGDDDLNLAHGLNNLASLRLKTGRPAEAEAGYREAADIIRKVEGESRSWATTVGSIGRARFEAGDWAAADSILSAAVAWVRARNEGDSGDLAKMVSWLGQVHHATGDLDAAEREFTEALDMSRRLQGDGVHLWTDLNNLAAVQRKRGKWAEAEALFRESLAYAVEIHGPDHFQVAVIEQNLAGTLARLGRFDEAERRYGEAIRIAEATLPPEHPNLPLIRGNLGECLLLEGRWGEAAEVLAAALPAAAAALGEEHPRVKRIAGWLEEATAHGGGAGASPGGDVANAATDGDDE